jgi:hypothetical protein
MVSLKAGSTEILTPSGGTLSSYAYREGAYVFYRNGKYYFLWSVDDTGAANYHVAYGTSNSPTGPITVAASPVVIIQNAANKIYGTGHNSVLQIPGKDEWYIVYHRINAAYLSNGPGYHREVCIDKLEFNDDGSIVRARPTLEGVRLNTEGTAIPHTDASPQKPLAYPNPASDFLRITIPGEAQGNNTVTIYSLAGKSLKTQLFAFSNEINLNVSDIPKGIYFFSVQNNQSYCTQKFIKN